LKPVEVSAVRKASTNRSFAGAENFGRNVSRTKHGLHTQCLT